MGVAATSPSLPWTQSSSLNRRRAVPNLMLLLEGLLSGSNGWERSLLLNNAETRRLRGTATNFSVRRYLVINECMGITREIGHMTRKAGPRRVVRTTNTEGCVRVEVNKGRTLEDEGSGDIKEQKGREVKERGSDDFREDASWRAQRVHRYNHSDPELRVES
jgi:hypothetical protein